MEEVLIAHPPLTLASPHTPFVVQPRNVEGLGGRHLQPSVRSRTPRKEEEGRAHPLNSALWGGAAQAQGPRAEGCGQLQTKERPLQPIGQRLFRTTPNALVPLLKVLIWWRTNLYMLMVDLARAYQALQTGPMELHPPVHVAHVTGLPLVDLQL